MSKSEDSGAVPSSPAPTCPKCGKPKLGPTSTIASGSARLMQAFYCGCGEVFNGVAPLEITNEELMALIKRVRPEVKWGLDSHKGQHPGRCRARLALETILSLLDEVAIKPSTPTERAKVYPIITISHGAPPAATCDVWPGKSAAAETTAQTANDPLNDEPFCDKYGMHIDGEFCTFSQIKEFKKQLTQAREELERAWAAYRAMSDSEFSLRAEATRLRSELEQVKAELADETYLALQLRQQVQDLMPQAERCFAAESQLGKAEAENKRLKETLTDIRAAACGEEQVAEDDIGGLNWIYTRANAALHSSTSTEKESAEGKQEG